MAPNSDAENFSSWKCERVVSRNNHFTVSADDIIRMKYLFVYNIVEEQEYMYCVILIIFHYL